MTNQTNGGIGFLGLLTLIFIVMKLLGKITWSWFWVLSPLYPGLSLLALLLLSVIGIYIYKSINY